jgi:GNAT superfamily N-acetyltransferase
VIKIFKAVDLTSDQIARCKELSYGDEGYMCEDLEMVLDTETRWHYRYSQALLLYLNKNIVGWCLLQPVPRSKRWSAQLFVDPLYRRRGYGRLLLQEANKISNRPCVYTDRDNLEFFDKMLEITNQDWDYV